MVTEKKRPLNRDSSGRTSRILPESDSPGESSWSPMERWLHSCISIEYMYMQTFLLGWRWSCLRFPIFFDCESVQNEVNCLVDFKIKKRSGILESSCTPECSAEKYSSTRYKREFWSLNCFYFSVCPPLYVHIYFDRQPTICFWRTITWLHVI